MRLRRRRSAQPRLKKVSAIAYSRHTDTKIDTMYSQQAGMTDPVARLKVVNEREKYTLNQAYNIPLLWYQRIVVYNSKIKGWDLTPSHSTGQQLTHVWLDE